jgi:hypothetical protein
MPYRVFVEKVENHSGQAIVVPVAVNEKEPLQELEPRDGKIRRHDSLNRKFQNFFLNDLFVFFFFFGTQILTSTNEITN